MRHGKKFNHLSRQAPHRKAMLANMACSLIEHKRINTTVAKAKALQKYIEPLITKSKTDSTHSRRIVFSYLRQKEAVTELFRDVSVKVADRPGGYTRILKTGFRSGDNAQMALIELVDYNENMLQDAKQKSSSSRRRRRGGAKKKDTTTVAETNIETTEAETKAEVIEELTTDTVEEVATEAVEETKEETKAAETTLVTEEPIEEVKAEEVVEVEAPAEEEVVEEPKAEDPTETEVKAEAADDEATKEEPKEDNSEEEDKKEE